VTTPVTEKATVATHYAATAIGAGVGLTINEWVAVGMFALAALTFVVNAVFKYLNYQLNKKKEITHD